MDIRNLSDDELDNLINQAQTSKPSNNLSSLSDDDLDRLINQAQGSKPAVNQPAPKQPTTNVVNNTTQPTKTLTGGVQVNVTNPNQSQSAWRNTGRQFARGTARALAPEKLENWAVGSKNDEALLNQYIQSSVPTYDQIDKDYRAGKIDKAQLKVLVNKRKHFDDLMADAEYRAVRNKNIGKGAVELGFTIAAGPVGGAAVNTAKLATRIGWKPAIRALSKLPLQQVGKIGKIGAGYGVTKGIIDEDVNPITEGAKQALIWAGTDLATLGVARGARMIGNTQLGKAVGKTVGNVKNKVEEKVFDAITSTEAGTKALQTVANAKNKLGEELVKPRTFKQVQQAKANAKANATPAVEETIAQNVDDVAPSQYGVAEDNSAINQQLADRMNNDVIAEQELLNEYNQKVATAKEQYGSVENLKAQAVKDMEKEQWGEVTQPLKDYRELVEYEKTLGQAKYVNPNSKSVVNGEYSGNVANAVSGKKTFKQARAEKVNKDQSGLVETNPQAEVFNPSMPEGLGSPVKVETGINTPKANLPHVNGAPIASGATSNIDVPQGTPIIQRKVGETGNLKESALAKNAKKSDEVADAIKENPTTYEAITNAETIAQAEKEIAENVDKVHADIVKKLADEKTDATALDVEKARQVFIELQNQGRLDEAVNLLAATSKEGSKLGQAVQAFSLWSKTTPEGAQLYAQKLLDKYNSSVRKDLQRRLSKKQLKEIGQAFKELNEKGLTGRELEIETAKAMKKVYGVVPKAFAQYLDGYRYINMLSSGKSRIKDFILTGKNLYETGIDETLAGTIVDPIRRLLTKDKTSYVSANPLVGLKEGFKGFKKGAIEEIQDIINGVSTSRSGEVGRYGLPKDTMFSYKPLSQLKEEIQGFNTFNKAKEYLGQSISNILHYPEKGLRFTLQVPDRGFYEARHAISLANQKHARKLKEATQDMKDSAAKEAKKVVYQEDRPYVKKANDSITNIVDIPSRWLEKVVGWQEGTVPSVSKGVSPFMKTPTNIGLQGLEGLHGSVSGLAELIQAVRQGNPKAIRQAELLMGRGIRGLGELGIGYAVGKGAIDNVKHNFGDDYTDHEVTGLKPNSVIIGDKAFSMENMQNNLPFFVGVGLGQGGPGQAYANARDVLMELPGAKLTRETIKTLTEIDNAIESGSTESNAFKKGVKKGNKAARNLAASYITSLIPYSGQLGEMRNDVDPIARVTNDPNPIKYMGNRIKNRIPWMSKKLPVKHNEIGEEVKVNNIENPLARAASEAIDFGVRNYKEPPRALRVAEYVARETGNEALLPPTITSRVTFKQGDEKITKELNAQELSDYKRRVGQLTFKYRPKSLKPLAKMTKDEFEEYASRIRQADSLAKQIVEHDMFKGNYPEAVKISKKGNISWMKNEKMLDLEYLQGEYNKIKQQEQNQAAKEKRKRLEKRARGK